MRSYAKSIALYERTKTHLAGGVSSNVRYASTPVPLFFERGEGARLYDVDGNVHIDYVLGNGPAILGHAPKPVIEAVARSLADGQVYAGQHPRETELAERLCRLLPGCEVVRFATSGTEAVLMALRLARAFTGRTKILKFEGHYHGWSDQAYISARPSLNEAGPADAPVPVAGSPGMPQSVLDDVVVAGWNDLAALATAFDRHPGEIAAVIMEPVMVNGGAVVPADGYLAGVRDLCRAKGALFICDEVITGFRVALRGAQGWLSVTADLAIYAKAVAAGFPLAMVAGRRDIMDTLLDKGVMHGGTYNGNVQSMAAAIATLDELERDGGAVYRALEQRGTRLMQGLASLAAKHRVPARVQGLPAIFQTFFTGGGRSCHGGADVSDIRLEGVSKRYGPVAAADDVDLAVAQGEFVTILGPSGSGKTTLLSLIAGLNRPTAGRIFIGGRDVTEAPAQERNIGLVFQSYALFPHMTVLENVLFPLGVRKIGGAVARSQALAALKLVRLEGLQDRRPSQLSGGQQQRVALARAIVFKPDILLLDEPLGALDRKLREELQVELKQLQRTLGVTTILVTHDQEEALSLSDRIMVLDKGRTRRGLSQAGQPFRRGVFRHRQFRRARGRPHRSGSAGAGAHRRRRHGRQDGARGRGDLSRPDGALSSGPGEWRRRRADGRRGSVRGARLRHRRARRRVVGGGRHMAGLNRRGFR